MNPENNIIEEENENEINNQQENQNEQPEEENEELAKKKKKDENLVIASNPNNNLIENVEEEVEVEQRDEVREKLAEVSRASGLNLKAFFVEENKKEIENENLGYTNFKFNGNMKEFYSKVYRHILESNLIARQLADENDRKKYPTFKELSEKFEEFMKVTGEELVKRGHLEKYEPFGGLSAKEIKEIENSCLLNRPRNEKEAIGRTVSNIEGKNFDEVVENGYKRAAETISSLHGPTYKKGVDPEKDKLFLQTSANLIKGMSVLRKSEKIWNPYFPDFSAPKWNYPIYKNLISNAFKAVGRGLSIAFDTIVKFPVNNLRRGLAYPFNKLANVISVSYNQRKLENLVYSKGFTKDELNSVINANEKPVLNVEEDAKAIDENYKANTNKIEEYKHQQTKEKVQEVDKKEPEVVKEEIKNENRIQMNIIELDDSVPKGEIVPRIDDEPNAVKQIQSTK